MIQGHYNPSSIVRLFLAHEYAFEIIYDKYTVRIGHTKGNWYIAKIHNDIRTVADRVIVYDFGSGIDAENSMTLALFQKMKELRWEKVGSKYDIGEGFTRDDDAYWIEQALAIWGGNPSKIREINVVQPGRNAMIDFQTGDFELNAAPNEFKA